MRQNQRSTVGTWGLVVVSSLLQILCFPIVGPVAGWLIPLSWLSLVPLLIVLLRGDGDGHAISLRRGAWVGYVCGVLWYFGNCSWIYQTMYLYGGLEKPVACLILLLFSLYLGLYHALFGALLLVARRSRLGVQGALVLSPFLWVAVELARARVTGFPWDLLGYTQIDNLLTTRLAPYAGVMGISFLVAAVNAGIAAGFCLRRPRTAWMISIVSLLLAVALTGVGASGLFRRAVSADVNDFAVMVQENLSVGAERKGQRALTAEEESAIFSAMSERPIAPAQHGQATVVIWPEAPADFHSNDEGFRNALSELARRMNAPVIAGSLGIDFSSQAERGYFLYDSASLFGRDGTYEGRYDKVHLVPWGEYVPFKDLFFFARKLTAGVGNMDPGQTRRVFESGGRSYGIFVCYESIFGDEVREFVKNGAEVLVNISDDGWYGDTGAPWQHLNMARMRAIENHRWVLRDTNTGETTAIDPWGRYTETPRHVRVAYELPFGFETRQTIYTRYGDWFAWMCVLVTLGAVGFGWWPKEGRGLIN